MGKTTDKKTAIIIGAGPAGLTAAYELLTRSDIKPIVIEREDLVGGIARTVNHNGNRIDLGGHRYFSKSDRVMDWWRKMMPVEGEGADSAGCGDNVLLTRNRMSRIYFLRRFFVYPISLSVQTIRNLGFARMIRIGFSYMRVKFFPIREERSLEDFYINRFGRELYKTFFKDYTHKLWGVECSAISPDWGSQRVKGISITTALKHMIRQAIGRKQTDIGQKDTETSLIDRFLYPKLGAGQMWECTAARIEAMGGEIRLGSRVVALHVEGSRITGVTVRDAGGRECLVEGDYCISTMPVRELLESIRCDVPEEVKRVASGLVYRDFMTAAMLLRRMKVTSPDGRLFPPDTWIYIQEGDVNVGRIQIFNNWSPYMVHEPGTVWIGTEYFVNEGDEFWTMDDQDFIALAVRELEQIGLIDKADLLDAKVVRLEKAYPAYFGSYPGFSHIRDWTDNFENLFLAGRNGMHRYNNLDHSMLTGMAAVENILSGVTDKNNIWEINSEQEYLESKYVEGS